MDDVLVFTPVLRLEPETIRAIMGLQVDGAISLLLQRDNPYGDGPTNHLHQYRRARDLFLAGTYDAVMVIESDIVPPADALRRLADLDADVAYGCYMFRPGNVVNVLQRYPQPARNVGESLSCHPGLWDSAKKQGVIECSGSGLGCILIRRNVIESVPFEMEPGAVGFFDYYWTEQVYRAGYSMKADTALTCQHIDTDGSIYAVP